MKTIIKKTIASLTTSVVFFAIIFFSSIALAALARKTTFQVEWANMISFFSRLFGL